MEDSFDIVKFLEDELDVDKNEHNSSKIFKIEAPHISLSKTFVLREHQIDSFIKDVQAQFSGFGNFQIKCAGISSFLSENKSRVFASALVRQGKKRVIQLIQRMDTIMQEYSKPTYFQDPKPHLSLSWSPNEKTTTTSSSSSSTTSNVVRTSNSYDAIIEHIYLCIGDRRIQIDLS